MQNKHAFSYVAKLKTLLYVVIFLARYETVPLIRSGGLSDEAHSAARKLTGSSLFYPVILSLKYIVIDCFLDR